MIKFFPPNSRALARLLSHFAQNTTPTPVCYSAVTNPFRAESGIIIPGYVSTQNTPNPTPKHPFSLPELESGQSELPSGQTWTPTEQNDWKVEKTFLEGAKKFIRDCIEASVRHAPEVLALSSRAHHPSVQVTVW